ncbi:hypothetical protein CBP33_04730 [Acidovorax carolinensis]|nr:hypothetical protein CBP33_04730 [Acidovorax carolinensis]
MHTSQSMVRVRWWILAWFLMSLGVATTSPMVQPRKMLDVVCSTGGALKVFALNDDGTVEPDSATLNCPQCLVGGAPPLAAFSLLPATVAVTNLPLFHPSPRAVAATAAPPPARAPPFFLSQS